MNDQVTIQLGGRTFRATLQEEVKQAASVPAKPQRYELKSDHQPRIRPCRQLHGGGNNQTCLFWVNVRMKSGDRTWIETFGVGADVIEDSGRRRLWCRPLYQSRKQMLKYSRNNRHPNHGFNVYLDVDGSALIVNYPYKANVRCRVEGQARNKGKTL